MSLVVQKYGGTSVGDAGKIKNVASRIAKRRGQGDDLVVVVSAMGKSTDQLISLAREISEQPAARELDVLLSTGEIVSSTLMVMALQELGVEAISLSGAQAGIGTEARYGRARILSIDTSEAEKIPGVKAVITHGFFLVLLLCLLLLLPNAPKRLYAQIFC